jgi:biotin carboxyl carrier protein
MHRPTDDDAPDAGLVSFPVDGTVYETRLTRKMRERRPWQAADRRQITTLIPGSIVRVLVAPGQRVKRGQGVVVLEAMKMRNEVQAPRDGTVKTVLVAAGQTVAKGALLVELD